MKRSKVALIILNRVLFLIGSLQLISISSANESSKVKISQGLTYSMSQCTVDGTEIELDEIQMKPNENLQLRVIYNSNASYDSSCSGGYGGPSIDQLIRRKENSKVLAATNGNFFRTQKKTKNKTGFIATGLLWSKTNSKQGKIYEKLRMKGGSDLFIVDHKGAHPISLKLEVCGTQTCASLAHPNQLEDKRVSLFSKKMNTDQLLRTLKIAFPKMTLVSQSTMDLTGGSRDETGHLNHYSECKTKERGQGPHIDDDNRSHWQCKKLPRTLLCGKRDGTISIFTTPSAYVYDLAKGLRVNGACATQCEVLFNLDGGGSTQMGFRDPKTKKFQLVGFPNDISSSTQCGFPRPVDHYFGFFRGL